MAVADMPIKGIRKIKEPLSRIPSKMIRQALRDLARVEESDQYVVDMADWHQPDMGRCAVCLAGAVIACRTETAPNKKCFPDNFPDLESRLFALNEFRHGLIRSAMSELDRRWAGPGYRVTWIVPRYQDDPMGFKQAMSKMADYLESKGS